MLDVEPVIAGRVELDRVSSDQKKRGQGIVVTDHPAQVGENATQINPCRSIGNLRPKQGSQTLSTMGALRLDGQISQQGSYLVGFKAGSRLTIQGGPKGSKES